MYFLSLRDYDDDFEVESIIRTLLTKLNYSFLERGDVVD